MRGMTIKTFLTSIAIFTSIQSYAAIIGGCFPNIGQSTYTNYGNYIYPSQVYSYGMDFSPSFGDMDQTLLYGLGGGLLGYGGARLFDANDNITILASLLGAGIGAYGGYQEDTSENIERAIIRRGSNRKLSRSSNQLISRQVLNSNRSTVEKVDSIDYDQEIFVDSADAMLN